MALRWEAGEKVGAQWYLDRYPDLGEDTDRRLDLRRVLPPRGGPASTPTPPSISRRFPRSPRRCGRVLEIHELVGSGTTATTLSCSSSANGTGDSPASVSRGRPDDRRLLRWSRSWGAGRSPGSSWPGSASWPIGPVALKVTRRGSREPQTLARLQHTHIVPVHSHRIDAATGLHLLCMPYFGRITLARVLADPEVQDRDSGAVLVEALDRLEPAGELPAGSSAGRRGSRAPVLLAGDRLVGRPAGRGPRPRPRPRRAPPRHQAVERAGHLRRHAHAPRLQPGARARARRRNGRRCRPPWAGRSTTWRPSTSRPWPRDLPSGRRPRRHLRPGRRALRGRHRQAALRVAAPRRSSVVEALLRAADDRLRPLPRLRDRHPEIPPALDAVIRRCLEPDPRDRYHTAAELAADLQAVADDLPLRHAREPWPSRAAGWLRRRRRRLACRLAILLAVDRRCGRRCSAIVLERSKDYALVQREYNKGIGVIGRTAIIPPPRSTSTPPPTSPIASIAAPGAISPDSRDLRHLGSQLTDKLKELKSGPTSRRSRRNAQEKSKLAERIARVRERRRRPVPGGRRSPVPAAASAKETS